MILNELIIKKTKEICDNDIEASLTTIYSRLTTYISKELELPKTISSMIVESKVDQIREGIRRHNMGVN